MVTKIELTLMAALILAIPLIIGHARLEALQNVQSAAFCERLNGGGFDCD